MSIEGSGASNGASAAETTTRARPKRADADLAQSASETAQSITEKARAKVADLADQASATTDDLVSRATDAVDRVHLAIQDNPYKLAGMAMLAGLIVGLMLGRGPKVVYVKRPD